MNEPSFLAQRATDFLLGTASSVDAFATNEGIEYDAAMDAVIEAEIDECTVCGWWCAHEDMTDESSEWVCFDCHEDQDQ